MTSRRLALGLRCIPMASRMRRSPCVRLTSIGGRWLKSPVNSSRGWGWLKTLKLSLESDTSTTSPSFSSSSMVASCEGVAASLALYWKMGYTFSTPLSPGPGLRKPGTATSISCRRGSFALITHFGAWKLKDRGCIRGLSVPLSADSHYGQTPRLSVSCLSSAY